MRKGIMHLICWTQVPTTREELLEILKGMTTDELVQAATVIRGNAGKLAWVELAARMAYFDFTIGVAHGADGARVTVEASAAPIHDLPKYS